MIKGLLTVSIICIFIILSVSSCSRSENYKSKETVSPFLEIKTIRVLPHIISSSADAKSIEEVLISSFAKYGTVLSSNNMLTKKEEVRKNNGNVFLTVDIQNIKDATSQNYLPVIHISVHLFEEARLLENNKSFICETWKMDEFFQELDCQQNTNAKVIEILQSILDKFKSEYLRANPQEKPVFFLGNAISSENLFNTKLNRAHANRSH